MKKGYFVYLNGLMTPASNNHFLGTIRHLREQEEMLINDRYISTTRAEEMTVGDFLQKEYEKEIAGFPGRPPSYQREAAVWAAELIYNASQLLLSRDKGGKDLEQLLAAYRGGIDAAAILSADLCLRFLPDVIGKAREINPDDALILLLEEVLCVWHYSGIGYFKDMVFGQSGSAHAGARILDAGEEEGVWGPVLADDCLRRLYVDRVIRGRVAVLANSPVLRQEVRAALGDYGVYFWKELQQYDESDR